MFFQCSLEPTYLDYNTLKNFIKSCHWRYFRKYDLLGHHHLGWGFAYFPENSNRLIIKRDITPIYRADWKNLTKIKTRFILVHARKAYPWKKNIKDIHPIDISEKYLITHNGTVFGDSIPKLNDPKLEKIKNKTSMDTRKYLSYIMDEYKKSTNLKGALESVFKNLRLGIGANAFFFNSNECNVITRQNTRFNGRHRTLFISKNNNTILVSTTPLKPGMLEIPNNSLIQLNLSNLKSRVFKLEI
ncbi:MAG: class II glutamine amidotransferase [Candidatus Hermodarchaeota archaeon]